MPKKPARNAFYFFMKELEPDLKREGRVFPNGMADVVPVAHPRWKALSEHEKARFENMAKEYKAKMRGVEGDKYKMDNVGNIISQRVNKNEVSDKRRQKERREVTAKWTGKDVTEEKFYFLHFQTLCQTQNGDYLPCELAVIEYSLQNGITKKFHKFVEPGPIPTGYRFACMNTSEETHQIPIENFEKADCNYTGMSILLENFINPNGELPEYPPFYCVSDNRDMNKYCLEWIHDRSRMGHRCRVSKVYALEDLLMDLYVHGEGPKISQSGCLDILTSHHWDYTTGTRCEFHEELECKFCSLAIVQRYAYAFSDSLAVVYGFKLTDKHLPSTAEEEIPCVILPAAPMPLNTRYFDSKRNQDSWSKGRGQRTERYRGRRDDYEDEESDEDDGTSYSGSQAIEPMNNSLRRPNVASLATGHSSWGGVSNQAPNTAQWPTLGRGNLGKYAGIAGAPQASTAPRPPVAWQSAPTAGGNVLGQSQIPTDKNSGSGGMPTQNMTSSVRPLGPRGIAPPGQTFSMRGVQNMGPVRMPTGLGMMGRGSTIGGRGNVPGSAGSTQVPVEKGVTVTAPVGRGFAPPAPSSTPAVGRGYAPAVGRGQAMPVGRGHAPPVPVGRGRAPPVGRGHAPSEIKSAANQMNGLSISE